jgi:hypothetical protein
MNTGLSLRLDIEKLKTIDDWATPSEAFIMIIWRPTSKSFVVKFIIPVVELRENEGK